ncbi:hypothetical protein E3N88_44178 [Mikania micrantha]|uniref:DYW domain-containing protein n=1 Tax=Mikania micrantha TaxID=192012 RepID=A0A5N6LD01_9ASTR|nr:hypothetical protein E3N88_44178 [Mikania micrantha]
MHHHLLQSLRLCATGGNPFSGKALHARILKIGLDQHGPLPNTLIYMYAKRGLLKDALQVFDDMRQRDLVSWASILTAYNRANLPNRSISIFPDMFGRDSLQPDHFVFASLVNSCAALNALQIGRQVHAQFVLSEFSSDDITKSSLVDMYAKCGSLDDARAVFDTICTKNSVSWTAIISGYAKAGRKSESVKLLRDMKVQDLFSWTALISGLIQSGHFVSAFHLFVEMQKEGIKIIDPFILSSVIGASANLAAQELGKQVHCLVLKLGFESNLYVCNTLIDIHVGLVNKGCDLFKSMVDDYGLKPNLQHYTCLLDLYSRSGYLDEAENLLNTMPFEVDEAVWASLLSACKRFGKTQMGIRIANRLMGLGVKDPSSYILLSNAYAGESMWENVAKVRRLMEAIDVKKEPGYSCVHLGKETEVFYAGETGHPMKNEMRVLLKDLDEEMRKRGYVPDVSFVLHDMGKKEKENQLFWHSERLAVAYGLLNGVPGSVIRVVKNLRVCGDCHTVLKFICSIVGREIVVRDASRFHHFKDGRCSCSDFCCDMEALSRKVSVGS